MKQFSYRVPERKIGEVFWYNGKRYQVMDGSEVNLHNKRIGCCCLDKETGNILKLCAFEEYCGMVNRRHRGYCVGEDRSDGKTVYFKEV